MSHRTRLSGLDVAFLCLDRAATPMHLGAVALFRPTTPVDPDAVAALLAERIAAQPRLRARARATLLPPGGAEWVDTPDFDPADHIRTYRLPDDALLTTYASSWLAQPLDLDRPLWGLHVVALPSGDFALLFKLHHALADGTGAVALAAGLFDGLGAPAAPRPVARPGLLDQLRQGVEVAGAVLRSVRPPWAVPLPTTTSARRRFGMVRLDADDIRQIRRRHGGTINDVVLAVLAGGLRDWMTSVGQQPDDGVAMRALIPVSVRGRQAVGGGNQLSGYLCDLPVGEVDPVARLRRVRAAMDANKEAGPTSGAGALPLLADRVPHLAHRLGLPLLASGAPLLFDTVVTTVPFPRVPLTLGGAALREVYPIVPLAPGHCVAVAVSPYLDSVHIGLNADADALDVRRLADAMVKSAATLHELCA